MAMAAITMGNTAGTMSTDARDWHPLRWILVAVGFLAGGFLIFEAVPRVGAYGALLPASATVHAIDEGRVVALEAVDAAWHSYTQALDWRRDDPRLLRERARLAMRRAALEPQSADRWRGRAVEDYRTAVAAAPGDGTAWARLAQAELENGADIEQVFTHLRLARLTAPRRASALLPQFSIVMRHWDAMPDEMRSHALDDLPSFWSRRALRPLLVTAYLDAGFPARAAFRVKLGENERALRDFDRLLVSSLGL